jgi:hypothetical protein
MLPYVSTEFKRNDFSCPLCNVCSHHDWKNSTCILSPHVPYGNRDETLDNVWFAICHQCKKYTVWIGEKMIHPQVNGSPPFYPGLSQEVKETYIEANALYLYLQEVPQHC